jgi:hypothetical protein
MNRTIILGITLFISVMALAQEPAANEKACDVLPLIRTRGRQITQWNLEVTGADLVNSEKLVADRKPTVPVGIIEDGLDFRAIPQDRVSPLLQTNLARTDDTLGEDPRHGTSVTNLIFNPLFGIAAPGFLASFTSRPCDFMKGWTEADTEYYRDHYQGTPFRIRCDLSETMALQEAAGTRILNLSGALGSWKPTEELFRRRSAILVASAGNDPTLPEYPTESLKSHIPAIVVGTITLDGTRAGSWGDAIDILAPNQTPSLSSGLPEEAWGGLDFGLTSGATPMVTSGLVAVMSYLPDIDVRTAERLLEKASTKTSMDKNLLNLYKLIQSTQRIEARLKQRGVRPTLTSVNQLLDEEGERLFDFRVDAKTAFEEAQKLDSSAPCEAKKQGALLRKAFLLNQDESTREALVDFYSTQARNVNEARNVPDFLSHRKMLNRLAKFYSTLK